MDKRKRHKVQVQVQVQVQGTWEDLRDLRGTRNRCVFAVHLHHAPHHTVRSSQFAVIHHTNRCWSLINCLFISCFFRIFRIKMTRGVEVLGRLRRTRNRCVFAMPCHAMPSYMPSSLWVFALSLIVIFLLIFLQNAERRRSRSGSNMSSMEVQEVVHRGPWAGKTGTRNSVCCPCHAMLHPCGVVHVVIHR